MPAPHDRSSFAVVISGPSGVGKDTVIQAALARDQSLATVATVKTRAPRPGEINGVHQVFLSEAEFDQWLAEDKLLEHAEVYGHRSGVPREAVETLLEAGRTVVLRTDVQGARTLKQRLVDPLLIFITAPAEARVRRMQLRAGDGDAEIVWRLAAAESEIAEADWFDVIIVNAEGLQDEAAQELLEAIADARVARGV